MNNLRPDERALQSENERSVSSDALLKKGSKAAMGIATAATGIGLSSRLAPFLNELIPTDLAIKGISKISPQVGAYLKKGMDQGLNVKDGINFLKENLSQSQSQNAPQQQNIIAQYDDKLHAFIDNEIKQGRSPLEAGAIARTKKEFEKSIKQIEKDHNTNWSSILESIYGSVQQPQQQNQRSQPIQQPQSSGSGNQALMALADKILSM